MKGVSFNLSTRIEFGNGYVDRAGELVKEQGAQKVMIVTDEGIRRAGITERVEASLKKAKISYVIFDQIMPNLLPLSLTMAVFYAIRKGIKVNTIIIAIFVIGLLGTFIGLL